MTRVIKFRGLMLDKKTWVYGYLESQNYIHTAKGASIQVLPGSVGQFTGQYDKDGAEIFEGDILQYKYHRDRSGKDIAEFTEVVEWDNDTDNYSGFAIHKKMEKKIIGSIHTHPELLKEKV